MKKLQLLALTMLLSTPFAITYTSAPAAPASDMPAATAPERKDDRQDNRQGDRDSKQDDRQARRQERLDGWKDAKLSLQTFSQDDDAVQAKMSSLQDKMAAQFVALQAEVASLPEGSTARANASDEHRSLKDILEMRRTDLKNRIDHLQSCISEHQAQIAREKTNIAAKQAKIDSGKEKADNANVEAPMSSDRITNLHEQVVDLKKCVDEKTAMVATVSAKAVKAQDALTALEAKIGAESMSTQVGKAAGKLGQKTARAFGLNK